MNDRSGELVTPLQLLIRRRLSNALRCLSALQENDRYIFKTSEMKNTIRDELIHQGYLTPIIRGWVRASHPGSARDDSTQWYANFWEFCATYCEERFGPDWHLSPEQSLLLHTENYTIPSKVIVFSPRAQNRNQPLPFQTSILYFRERHPPAQDSTIMLRGLRIFTLPAALVRIPISFFRERPIDAEVALGSVQNIPDLISCLLDGIRPVIAGQLAGAFRHIGRKDIAAEIHDVFKRLLLDIREENPFQTPQRSIPMRGYSSPIAGRVRSLWEAGRQRVITAFPPEPGLPNDVAAYMANVENIYHFDAYHSLRIEGYAVTPELIERVASENWHSKNKHDDHESLNALAVRGYLSAFEQTKQVLAHIFSGEPAGHLIRRAHIDWYRSLFEPYTAAGLAKPGAFSGYRKHRVYLRASRHIPPYSECVEDAMETFFDLLEAEPLASVRAIMGHWLLGYIHPFNDGNGRTARLLMNAMLASGGYSWTVIRVEQRKAYLHALERASVDHDVASFVDFIVAQLGRKLEFVETPPKITSP